MTAVVEMASIPPWRKAILDKKKLGDASDQGSQLSSEPTANRKGDFLSKTQISENTFFYTCSSSSSSRDLKRNDVRSVGKPVKARPSQSEVEVLVNNDTTTEWNIPNTVDSKVTGINMVCKPNHSEVNSNGTATSLNSIINGALVDKERIGPVHDNPFIKNFGRKNVIKPVTDNLRVSSSSESSVGGSRLNSTEMPEMEEEYKPGSGFVHKLLDKFALLRAKDEALHPTFNHHLPKRAASLENLVDNDALGNMPNSQRVSVGDEVFTTSPRYNLQYYSKAKSVENLSNRIYSEGGSQKVLDNKKRSGSDGRHRAHPAPDANLAREDIIIIETTPSPKPNDDNLSKQNQSSRRRRTSSSERHLEQDELPKPNTVSSYRKKFESSRSEKTEAYKQRRNKEKAHVVGTKDQPQPVINHVSATEKPSVKVNDNNLPDVVKVNGESSRDSSFDLQADVSAESSLDNYDDKDYENPVYDAIRASLRHVKPKTEEEITYSWKRNSGSDQLEPKPSGSTSTTLTSTSVINTVSNQGNQGKTNNVSKPTATLNGKSTTKVPSVSTHKETNVSKKETIVKTNSVDNSISHTTKVDQKSNPASRPKVLQAPKSVSTVPEKAKLNNKPLNGESTVSTKTTVPETVKSSNNSVVSKPDTVNIPVSKPAAASSSSKIITTTTSNISNSSVSKSSTTKSSVTTSIKGPAPQPPKTNSVPMVQVGPSSTSLKGAPPKTGTETNRSRNRFGGDEKEDPGYIQAGKTWFYDASKINSAPEGVKRPNNSQSSDPVPKKRSSTSSTNQNTFKDSTDSSGAPTPKSNIDDYINNESVPVTNLDLNLSTPSGNLVPRLDLSGLSEIKTVSSPPRVSPSSKKIQPCNYEFSGANVIVGKSLLNSKKKKQKLKLKFDDTSNSTYEYPCEELMLEEYLNEHPNEKQFVLTLNEYIADKGESSDDGEVVFEEPELPSQTLRSTPGIGHASGGLSSYRSKNQIEYQFGMEFERQAEREREQQRHEQEASNSTSEDGDLIPADEEELSGFSTTSGIPDILF